MCQVVLGLRLGHVTIAKQYANNRRFSDSFPPMKSNTARDVGVLQREFARNAPLYALRITSRSAVGVHQKAIVFLAVHCVREDHILMDVEGRILEYAYRASLLVKMEIIRLDAAQIPKATASLAPPSVLLASMQPAARAPRLEFARRAGIRASRDSMRRDAEGQRRARVPRARKSVPKGSMRLDAEGALPVHASPVPKCALMASTRPAAEALRPAHVRAADRAAGRESTRWDAVDLLEARVRLASLSVLEGNMQGDARGVGLVFAN